MIYSKTCEYAIRSLIYFADHPEKDSATVKTVSRETKVPQAYVAKIFQCLARRRILSSRRGPNGGYALLIAPAKLSLIKIIHALDDLSQSSFSRCVMGLQKCNDRNPCPLHPIWVKAKEEMLERLGSSTISDVAVLGDKFKIGRQRRFLLSKHMRNIFSVR